MRTNIDINDRLMRQVMLRSGARTKRAAVEAGSGCWQRRTRKARSAGCGEK
ncbi:MAG: type II toxin-antitoxin system VapB family antitoxin [Candidatus Sulfotelmatobacter sp.]